MIKSGGERQIIIISNQHSVCVEIFLSSGGFNRKQKMCEIHY